MAKTDAQLHRQARLQNPTVKSHLAYILLSGFALMVMYTLLRIGLLVYNREMIGDTPASTFLEALFNGTRFDLRLTVYLLIPLVLSLFTPGPWQHAGSSGSGSRWSAASRCSSALWKWTSTVSFTSA